MAISIRNEGAKINSSINVAPMIDVTLVLLIIFMVAVPMLIHSTSIEMVKTRNPVNMADANKADAMIVSIMRDGQIFLGARRVSGDTLTQKVKEQLSSRADKTRFCACRCTRAIQFRVNAVDDVRSAGVDQLGLLTEKKAR